MQTFPRQISERVWVCAQIEPDDIGALAGAGFTMIVNHRPDGEEPWQPTAEAVSREAEAAGLKVLHAPVRGLPHPAAVEATRGMLNAMGPNDRALLFCRSGMRSACAWAMAERANGVEADALRAAALTAGYDLGGVPL